MKRLDNLLRGPKRQFSDPLHKPGLIDATDLIEGYLIFRIL